GATPSLGMPIRELNAFEFSLVSPSSTPAANHKVSARDDLLNFNARVRKRFQIHCDDLFRPVSSADWCTKHIALPNIPFVNVLHIAVGIMSVPGQECFFHYSTVILLGQRILGTSSALEDGQSRDSITKSLSLVLTVGTLF